MFFLICYFLSTEMKNFINTIKMLFNRLKKIIFHGTINHTKVRKNVCTHQFAAPL